MKVAYQGIVGAFSHQACLSLLPDHKPLAQTSFEAVILGVTEKRADLGILPLENVVAGPVPGVRLLIEHSSARLISEHLLPIRIHLLGLRNTTLRQIVTVRSHPMALRQCRRLLKRLAVNTKEAPNTAIAASDLRNPAEAVLASETAAAAYGLDFLLRDVHDDPENATLFGIIAR